MVVLSSLSPARFALRLCSSAAARAAAAAAAAAPAVSHTQAPSSSSSSSSSSTYSHHHHQQHRHYAGKASFPIPESVKAAFEKANAPFAAALIPGAGRGLVATRPLARGERVLREAPLIAVPSVERRSSSCYRCLAPVDAAAAAAHKADGREQGVEKDGPLRVALPGGRGDALFCGAGCLAEARTSFFDAEVASGGGALAALDSDCREAGERFPLLAARLAVLIVQRHSNGSGSGDSDDGPKAAASAAAATAGNSPFDPLYDVGFLCHANVPPPPPAPWARAHAHLHAALSQLVRAGGGGDARAAAEAASALDLDWFVAVMARLHLNTFRVDLVPLLNFADLAASISSITSSSSGGGSAGSALYLTASLLNHACEPNVDVTWPRNDAVAAFTAARDIDAGEQLTITYTDSDAAVAARRARLFEAYDFECGCALCTEQLADGG